MEWVETTGRTIDEAREAALDQLGVDESDAEVVVLAEPRPGLFGRWRGEARVRARVRPTAPRPKRNRGRRPTEQRRRQGGRQGKQEAAGRAQVALASGPGSPIVDAGLGATTEATGPAGNGALRADNPGSGGTAPAGGSKRGRRRRGRRGRSGQGGSPGEGPLPPASGVAVEVREEEGGAPMTLTLEEQGEAARGFLAGLLAEMGIEAEIDVRVVDEQTAEVAVHGPALGVLIGPGGATLGALQELARTVVQRRTGGHSDRILVDVAGYRARRAEALRRFTRQVAEEVLSTGSERALEPMSAADRKIVHDTVNEIAGVQTRSEGEDPGRYIVISPAERSPEGGDGS